MIEITDGPDGASERNVYVIDDDGDVRQSLHSLARYVQYSGVVFCGGGRFFRSFANVESGAHSARPAHAENGRAPGARGIAPPLRGVAGDHDDRTWRHCDFSPSRYEDATICDGMGRSGYAISRDNGAYERTIHSHRYIGICQRTSSPAPPPTRF